MARHRADASTVRVLPPTVSADAGGTMVDERLELSAFLDPDIRHVGQRRNASATPVHRSAPSAQCDDECVVTPTDRESGRSVLQRAAPALSLTVGRRISGFLRSDGLGPGNGVTPLGHDGVYEFSRPGS